MNTQKSKEWSEGFLAARDGKPPHPPYPMHSQQASDWSDGYHAAMN